MLVLKSQQKFTIPPGQLLISIPGDMMRYIPDTAFKCQVNTLEIDVVQINMFKMLN